MSKIAKISVENFDSKEQILYDFDKSKGLTENIKTLCKKFGLPESRVYGLKYLPTKANEKNHYISEKNYDEIKHSDCLKVVFSAQYIINRIINNIDNESVDMKQICFDDILKYSLDPVFIEELANLGEHKTLINVFVNNLLSSQEQLALLMTMVHLFSKGFITDTSEDILQKTINILKNTDTSSEELRYALSMLQKILVSKNPIFDGWKEKIIRDIPIPDLIPYIWREDSAALQYNTLLLINTIIRLCKGDKKQQLIKEMNYRKTREHIYNCIILRHNFDKLMEHELYVLQTYLLSLFNEALRSEINLNENTLFKREEFELCTEDMRRITILMDFDEENFQNQKYFSVEDLVLSGGNRDSRYYGIMIAVRISMSSMRSDDSFKTSSKRSSTRQSESYETENPTISHLTLEALRHYKKYHYKNFYQSQIEEKLYEPGIFITSEKVVKMLAKILHVGVDPPDSKSTFYQPIVFYCSPKTPFFLELFSRTMWLLSQTRREMKASTFSDYPKVMHILEKQVRAALKIKPKDFKSLTQEMSNRPFKAIIEQIQNDKEEEMKNLIDTHPCIIELKKAYIEENEMNLFQHRINCLLHGAHFPKVFEKKTSGNILVKLSKNLKELLVHDMVNVRNSDTTLKEKYLIADITHIVIGKNCKHSNLCQNPMLAFSIIVNHEEKTKFIAKDERTAAYWTDALILLTTNGKSDKLSKYYSEELNELVNMDIRLKLLELQNIPIPKSPPPVPPPPEIVKPPVPPKPKPRKLSRML